MSTISLQKSEWRFDRNPEWVIECGGPPLPLQKGTKMILNVNCPFLKRKKTDGMGTEHERDQVLHPSFNFVPSTSI
jgi:hypothetical protein